MEILQLNQMEAGRYVQGAFQVEYAFCNDKPILLSPFVAAGPFIFLLSVRTGISNMLHKLWPKRKLEGSNYFFYWPEIDNAPSRYIQRRPELNICKALIKF